MPNTKIICTLGPATETKTKIKQLISAGMDAARLNFSHGAYSDHAKIIQNIRAASKEKKTAIALIADLQGPRIRLGELPKTGVKIKQNEQFALSTAGNYIVRKKIKHIPIDYKKLYEVVRKGDQILIEDGTIEAEVVKVQEKLITVIAKTDATLKSHKGINIPGVVFNKKIITKKDTLDLQFSIQNNIDYIAMSFVQNRKDVLDLKKLIKQFTKKGSAPPKIISKIERPQAIKNIDGIIDASDAVMVARGDLGIEMPAHKVPFLQKEIIEKCMRTAKPVIVATQMLNSMIQNSRPTRAEVSDVASAVIDHADMLMLSGETTEGKYPIKACEIMNKIISETEKSPYDDLNKLCLPKHPAVDMSIGHACFVLAKETDAVLIAGIDIAGSAARWIAGFRPEVPIIITAKNEREKREIFLSWGLQIFETDKKSDEDIKKEVIRAIKTKKLAKKGERIILVSKNNKTTKFITILSI